MKKLIATLEALGLVATETATVISCWQNDNSLVSTIMESTEFNKISYEIYEYNDWSLNTKESMQYPLIEAIFFIWSAENENEIINELVTPNNQNEFKTWLKSAENNELNNLKQNGKHYWYERDDEKYSIQYENWSEKDISNFEELLKLLTDDEANLNIGLINDSKFSIKVENKNEKYNSLYSKIINPLKID